MRDFVFYDKLSERLYNVKTGSGSNLEMVDKFREMTRPFDARCNAIPDSCSLSLNGVMATEVNFVSESIALKHRLVKLIAAIPDIGKAKRRDYENRLQGFIDRAQSHLGMHSVSLLSEEPLVVRSRLFKRVSISLEYVGGYLIRLFFNFEPSDYLLGSILQISREHYDTRLKLCFKHPLFRRHVIGKPCLGSDIKRTELTKLDQAIQANICEVIRTQVMPGIYLKQFLSIPLLQRYETNHYPSDASEDCNSLPSTERTSFFDLLLSPSSKYSQTVYYSDCADKLVEYRPHSGRSLNAFAKLIATKQSTTNCFDVLHVFAEKEALWLQSSLIYDVGREYASSLLAKNTKSLKRERQEMYKQEVIHDTLIAAFKFRNKLRQDYHEGPITGLLLPIGHNSEIDFGKYGYGQIRQASRLINEHLRPLIRRSVIVKDEAETAFQRWIQCASIGLAVVVFPIAQVFWERVADCLFPSANAPIHGPAQKR